MLEKLFGTKEYRYCLELVEPLPEVFYKERNFNMSIKLVDFEGTKIMNSNVLRLCFSVCDVTGKWVA
jgi:hypothetical protein